MNTKAIGESISFLGGLAMVSLPGDAKGIETAIEILTKLREQAQGAEPFEEMADQLTEAMQRWGWEHCADGPDLIQQIDRLIEQARVPRNPWMNTDDTPPPFGQPINGYNHEWIDEDFNPKGVRECFRHGDGTEWICSKWNDYHDCYETVENQPPTHWSAIHSAPA